MNGKYLGLFFDSLCNTTTTATGTATAAAAATTSQRRVVHHFSD